MVDRNLSGKEEATIARICVHYVLILVPGYSALALSHTVLTFLAVGFMCEMTEKLSWQILLTAYALSFFFSNLGPNTTTYVLSAETFPTEIRATCHGLSAAAGKLGAVIGAGKIFRTKGQGLLSSHTASLSPILDKFGLGVVFIICGAVAGLGCIVTLAFVKETKGQTLEKISNSKDAAASH